MPRKTRKRHVGWRGESREILNLIDRIDRERGECLIESAEKRKARELEYERKNTYQRRRNNRALWALYWHTIADNLSALSGLAREKAYQYDEMEIVATRGEE